MLEEKKYSYLARLTSLIVLAGLSACAFDSKPEAIDVPPQARVPKNINHVAQVAQNAGVVDCVGRLHQVSDYLIKGNPDNSVAFFMPPKQVNDSMLSASFEINIPSALTYASTYFSPHPGTGCDGAYEAITFWEKNCNVVASKNFVRLKRLGMIRKHILALDGGPQLRVFLMPAGKGCISIKKELIY